MLGDYLSAPANPTTELGLTGLQVLLQELFGQAATPLGAQFPKGLTATGTLPLVQLVDVASLSSPSGATANLKSFPVPGGTLGVPTFRGLRFQASGSFANNVNAKTVTVAFGGSAAQTAVTATTSAANFWHVVGGVYVRSSTSVLLVAGGTQGPTTGSGGAVDLAITSLTLTNALTLQFACTQTSAADVVMDTLNVWWIP